MSAQLERALLGIDNTGAYWIIHRSSDRSASTFVFSRGQPSISVEDLIDLSGETLQSKRLQELEAIHFERSWYIKDIQAFESACNSACEQRLRNEGSLGLGCSKRDWAIEDIDIARASLHTTHQTRLEDKSDSMSKRARESSPESPPEFKRYQQNRNSFDFGRGGDSYRPRYDRYAQGAVPTSAKTKPGANHRYHQAKGSPSGQVMQDGVAKSRQDDRLDQPRKPLQHLQQISSPAAAVFSPNHHDVLSTESSRSGGYDSHTSTPNTKFDYSGVPRGPKQHRSVPSESAQLTAYHSALDQNHPHVLGPGDIARLKENPHIFISNASVPFFPATISHLQRFIQKGIKDAHIHVEAEASGYYVPFPDNAVGRKQLQRCHEAFHMKKLFDTYVLNMETRPHGEKVPHPPVSNTEERSSKPDDSSSKLEKRPGSSASSSDILPAFRRRARADDELSMSSAITPSEVSSSTARVKTQCAECKSGHFPSYNSKFACSSCPRHYHLRCRKPVPRPGVDLDTWQCDYCIRKKRPKPASKQSTTANTPSRASTPESRKVAQDHKALAINGNEMHAPEMSSVDHQHRPFHRNVNGADNTIQELGIQIKPDQQKSTASNGSVGSTEREISPMMNGSAIQDGRKQLRNLAETNGPSLATEKQHSPQNAKTASNTAQLFVDIQQAIPKLASLQNGVFETAEQVQPALTSDGTNTNQEEEVSDQHQGTEESYGQSIRTQALPNDGSEATFLPVRRSPELQPEIPDFSLDVFESSSEGQLSPGDRSDRCRPRLDEYTQASDLITNSELPLDSQPLRLENSSLNGPRNSLVHCRSCGKTMFAKSGRTDERICTSCKNRKTAPDDDTAMRQARETAEQVWRRRLQPTKPEPENQPTPPQKLQEEDAPARRESEPSRDVAPERPIGRLMEILSRDAPPPTAQITPGVRAVKQAISLAPRDAGPKKSNDARSKDGSGSTKSPAAARAGLGEGPSSATGPLKSRSDPVNENNNNDDAGMETDSTRPTSARRAERERRNNPKHDFPAANDAKASINSPQPPAKLPALFSWPDLVGFALAEARDHLMTAAQVHQWIVDNVEGYDIQNQGHRSSIAATISQQKSKFHKGEPILEGARSLSRWTLAPSFVPAFSKDLKRAREEARHELLHNAGHNGAAHRREESGNNLKYAHNPGHSSSSRMSQSGKDAPKSQPQATETPMFIYRHRVAYDSDGRDIVPGYKDEDIEDWTELELCHSFGPRSNKFYRGDYVKAPLPNRHIFADYVHKPIAYTVAQIEEIRRRRDEPGYAVLVQWYLNKEAADWWKCRHVKQLWPKDENAGMFVPATTWHVINSDWLLEQEKQDAGEMQDLIIPNLFFDLEQDSNRLLYLKEGKSSELGIAFGNSSQTITRKRHLEAEDASAGLECPVEDGMDASSDAVKPAASQDSISTKPTSRSSQTPQVKQQAKKTLSIRPSPAKSTPRSMLSAPTNDDTSPALGSLHELPLERSLFTPSPAPNMEHQDLLERASRLSEEEKSTYVVPPPPAKKTRGVTDDEQRAVLEFIRNEQAAADYKIKDLFAAAPEYDPDRATFDREAKMAEIKARPTRKQRFTKRLAYARLERPPHKLHVEVEWPLPRTYKAPPSHTGPPITPDYSPRKSSFFDPSAGDSQQDVEMVDAGAGAAAREGSSDNNPNKPEVYSTLEELLGLPEKMVPTLCDRGLAFRDGTLVNGRLPRASTKNVWKVGRNVPGELK